MTKTVLSTTPLSLLVSPDRTSELRSESVRLPSWDLTARQVWDIELLINGGFSPLRGFMSRADYDGVCARMRLGDGTLFPIPVTLDVSEAFAARVDPGGRIALRHPEGMVLAVMTVSDKWVPDRMAEAAAVLGTTQPDHPSVAALLHRTDPVYVAGSLEGIELPPHHTFRKVRHTPAELRAEFARRGWKRIVAFQTRNPLHRAHEYALVYGAEAILRKEVNPAVHAELLGRLKTEL